MHASISTFRGDPDELLARYDAMVAEVPAANSAKPGRSARCWHGTGCPSP